MLNVAGRNEFSLWNSSTRLRPDVFLGVHSGDRLQDLLPNMWFCVKRGARLTELLPGFGAGSTSEARPARREKEKWNESGNVALIKSLQVGRTFHIGWPLLSCLHELSSDSIHMRAFTIHSPCQRR